MQGREDRFAQLREATKSREGEEALVDPVEM